MLGFLYNTYRKIPPEDGGMLSKMHAKLKTVLFRRTLCLSVTKKVMEIILFLLHFLPEHFLKRLIREISLFKELRDIKVHNN